MRRSTALWPSTPKDTITIGCGCSAKRVRAAMVAGSSHSLMPPTNMLTSAAPHPEKTPQSRIRQLQPGGSSCVVIGKPRIVASVSRNGICRVLSKAPLGMQKLHSQRSLACYFGVILTRLSRCSLLACLVFLLYPSLSHMYSIFCEKISALSLDI